MSDLEASRTSKDDHDLLIRMDTKMDIFLGTQTEHKKKLDDHDAELRALSDGHSTLKTELAIVRNEPRITPKALWTYLIGFLGAGSGIVALLNLIMHH